MSKYLAEIIPAQILDYVQSNINTALAAELAVFTDGITPLAAPEQYYDYEEAEPAQCPAFYILEDRIDYRLEAKGANHINAIAYFRCGMICEDFRAKELVHQVRRYANVLHSLLNERRLEYTVSGTTYATDIIKIESTSFSDVFRKNAEANGSDGPFRKEFVHELQIEHYENFS